MCILVLKKCKKFDDVLFINAAEHYDKGKRQNVLHEDHIKKIVDTYRERPAKEERYARRVSMEEIEQNDFNLNISRYVSTATDAVEIKLDEVHQQLMSANQAVADATALHNKFLRELGLPLL